MVRREDPRVEFPLEGVDFLYNLGIFDTRHKPGFRPRVDRPAPLALCAAAWVPPWFDCFLTVLPAHKLPASHSRKLLIPRTGARGETQGTGVKGFRVRRQGTVK